MGTSSMELSNQSMRTSSGDDSSSWSEALAISSALGSARPLPSNSNPSPKMDFINTVGGLDTNIRNSHTSHTSHTNHTNHTNHHHSHTNNSNNGGLNVPRCPPVPHSNNNINMNSNDNSIGSLTNRLDFESRFLRAAAGIRSTNVNSIPKSQKQSSQPPGLSLPSNRRAPNLHGQSLYSLSSNGGNNFSPGLPHVGSFNLSDVDNSNGNGMEDTPISRSSTSTSGRSAEQLYRGAMSYDTADNQEWSIEDLLKRTRTS